MTFGSLSDTAMSSMRPPILAGPIERKRNDLSKPSVDWLISGGGCTGVAPCGNTVVTSNGIHIATRAARATRRIELMNTSLIGFCKVLPGYEEPLLSELDDGERLRRTDRRDTVADELSERRAIPARRDQRRLRRTAATAEPAATKTPPLTLIGARRSRLAAADPHTPPSTRRL